MADEQWVNLPEDAKYVEDGIASIDRLGPLALKVTFKKASLAGFRVRVFPQGDHATYTPAETGRNQNFRVRIFGFTTNASATSVTLTKDIYLSAAGGNIYKAQAKYKKKVVESGKVVEVRRKLFYQVMQMRGITAGSTAAMESAYWDTGKKFYIKMKQIGGVEPIDHMRTIVMNRSAAHDKFIKAAKAGFKIADRKPYCFAVAFVEYIATPKQQTIRDEVNLTLPSKLGEWTWSGSTMTIQLNQFLWYGLDPDDDKNKAWLVGGRLVFKPDGGGANESITFDPKDVEIAGANYRTYGGKAKVKVRIGEGAIDRNTFSSRKGKWIVELDVLTVGGWTNGFAYNGINLLAISDKVIWEDQTAAVQKYTINHEVGHKVGNAVTGVGPVPDNPAPANLYGENRGVNDQDHQGPHCQKGAAWDGTKPAGQRWSGAPQCVMFGADGIYDAGGTLHSAPPEFCSDCEKAVRKLDLQDATLRTTGFQKTLDEV